MLEARLAPLGFVAVGRDWLHRKTWNTNRGVAVTKAPAGFDVRAYVETLRASSVRPLRHSWWAQLGLQIVLESDGPPPSETDLAPLVDRVNHQGVLVQSVFVIDATTGQWRQARTWGQLVTGKFQDAIAAGLEEVRTSKPT